MNVEINTSVLEARMAAAELKMRTGAVNQEIRVVARAAAEELRRTDNYQNRTGLLRKRTRIRREPGATVLEMDTHYAKHVIRRGFSRWETVVARARVAAEARMQKYVESL